MGPQPAKFLNINDMDDTIKVIYDNKPVCDKCHSLSFKRKHKILKEQCQECYGVGRVKGKLFGTNKCKPCKGEGTIENPCSGGKWVERSVWRPVWTIQVPAQFKRKLRNLERIQKNFPDLKEGDRIHVDYMAKGTYFPATYNGADEKGREDYMNVTYDDQTGNFGTKITTVRKPTQSEIRNDDTPTHKRAVKKTESPLRNDVKKTESSPTYTVEAYPWDHCGSSNFSTAEYATCACNGDPNCEVSVT